MSWVYGGVRNAAGKVAGGVRKVAGGVRNAAGKVAGGVGNWAGGVGNWAGDAWRAKPITPDYQNPLIGPALPQEIKVADPHGVGTSVNWDNTLRDPRFSTGFYKYLFSNHWSHVTVHNYNRLLVTAVGVDEAMDVHRKFTKISQMVNTQGVKRGWLELQGHSDVRWQAALLTELATQYDTYWKQDDNESRLQAFAYYVLMRLGIPAKMMVEDVIKQTRQLKKTQYIVIPAMPQSFFSKGTLANVRMVAFDHEPQKRNGYTLPDKWNLYQGRDYPQNHLLSLPGFLKWGDNGTFTQRATLQIQINQSGMRVLEERLRVTYPFEGPRLYIEDISLIHRLLGHTLFEEFEKFLSTSNSIVLGDRGLLWWDTLCILFEIHVLPCRPLEEQEQLVYAIWKYFYTYFATITLK